MDSERWQQIDQLFHSALEREPAERAAFLAQTCAGDDSLRKEVQSLIESHELSDSFIETPAADLAAELLASGAARLTAGQSVGPYQIVSLLGEGGMGEVYLADDTRLNRKIALKLLPPHFTVNPDRVRRFDREARAASALNHPNIVTIYEIGQSNSAHFIATEFVDGKTLRQLINEKPFTLSEALNVAIQAAGALTGAHTAGIVHRDIKPENIMLRADGYVKILDFGLAKLTQAQITDSELETPTLLQSNPGLVMGTVQYMSPEQARGKNVAARADIWSLGIVLYEMLAGHVPFSGETPSHVMVSLMEDELPPLADCANVPGELDRIVTKALRKSQDDRYQTAGQLARDLKALKQKLQLDARLSALLKAIPSRKKETDESLVADAGGSPAARASATVSVELPSRRTSSGEDVVERLKRHKIVLVGLLGFVAIAIGLAYVFRPRSLGNISATNRSIAVLPFKNDTGDANVEYVSDGLSETLITNLSQLPELKVTARNSAFKYKGKDVDARQVARSLGVDSILMGRIEQRGDQLVITVELINGADATHIWGDEYTRKASELIVIKSEISRDIVHALRVQLTAGEQQRLAKRETVNPQAYELLLRGRFYLNKAGTENRWKAAEYFQQAMATDPKYAVAYAELSLCYSNLVNNLVVDPREFMPKAEEAARTAMELNENCAECHRAMAEVRQNAWDWPAAEREFKRALELSPNLSGAHIGYAFYLMVHGRGEEAIVEARRARELDPISRGPNAAVVYALLLTRQVDEALSMAKDMLELDSNNPAVHTLLAQVYNGRREYVESLSAAREAIRLGDDSPDAQIYLGFVYAKIGQRTKTRAILEHLQSGKQYVSPVGFAILYVALGQHDRALALLEDAYAAHDQQLIWLRVESGSEGQFGRFFGNPRFVSLLKRIGFK
jgi:serine/threonine protein kinase/Flp pilus assembly protein TadD